MLAFPYAQLGFYADEPGYAATDETFATVTLGATSPSSDSLVPKVEPETPDPNAAVGYAPRQPYPTIVQSNWTTTNYTEIPSNQVSLP